MAEKRPKHHRTPNRTFQTEALDLPGCDPWGALPLLLLLQFPRNYGHDLAVVDLLNEKENSYYSKNLNDPGTISESLPDKSIQSFDNVTKEEDEITNEDNYPTKKQDSSQENFIENVINDS